eukprot:TRINITY_DN9674_c0_g1_i10.p1 TRINITY_DN9674_c0_g1~~TRINITY_DN9674_c0_g1_i10.p1  ORF type:complete len:301 (-),score=18.27 TRINITY_DN9674_c0_g1_i10:95-997(-)
MLNNTNQICKMLVCCKGCEKCIDSCCSGCCKCLNETCGGLFECIGNTFQRPFSFCAFIAFLILFIPGGVGIAIAVSSGYDTSICNNPNHIGLIVQCIILFLNFVFCIYLCVKYGKAQAETQANYNGPGEDGRSGGKDVCETTKHLLLYDVGVCIYMVFILFAIVWTILGYIWNGGENSICKDKFSSVFALAEIARTLTWVFFIGGLIFGLLTLIILACEEGSCTVDSTLRYICLIMTCCMCDMRKKNQKPGRSRAEIRRSYSNQRTGWVDQSTGLLGKLGIMGRRRQMAVQAAARQGQRA